MKLIPSAAIVAAGLMIASSVSSAAIVTEFTTWSLMLMGFGGLAAMLRAPRPQPVRAAARTTGF